MLRSGRPMPQPSNDARMESQLFDKTIVSYTPFPAVFLFRFIGVHCNDMIGGGGGDDSSKDMRLTTHILIHLHSHQPCTCPGNVPLSPPPLSLAGFACCPLSVSTLPHSPYIYCRGSLGLCTCCALLCFGSPLMRAG